MLNNTPCSPCFRYCCSRVFYHFWHFNKSRPRRGPSRDLIRFWRNSGSKDYPRQRSWLLRLMNMMTVSTRFKTTSSLRQTLSPRSRTECLWSRFEENIQSSSSGRKWEYFPVINWGNTRRCSSTIWMKESRILCFNQDILSEDQESNNNLDKTIKRSDVLLLDLIERQFIINHGDDGRECSSPAVCQSVSLLTVSNCFKLLQRLSWQRDIDKSSLIKVARISLVNCNMHLYFSTVINRFVRLLL